MTVSELEKMGYEWSNQISYEELDNKLDNGQTIFDYLLNNSFQFDNEELNNKIACNKEYLKKIVFSENEAYFNFKLLTEEILMKKYDENTTNIEFILSNTKYNFHILWKIKNDSYASSIINMLCKCDNDFFFLSSEISSNFFKEKNGKCIADCFKNNDEILKKLISKQLYIEDAYNFCLKNSRLDLFKEVDMKILCRRVGNITLFECLLKNGITPVNSDKLCEIELADVMIKYERYDLLEQLDINFLTNNPSVENSYLDILINKFGKDKSKFDTVINNLNSLFELDDESNILEKLEAAAIIYIKLIKNDILSYEDIRVSKFLNDITNNFESYGKWFLKIIYKINSSVLEYFCTEEVLRKVYEKYDNVENMAEKLEKDENNIKFLTYSELSRKIDDGETYLDFLCKNGSINEDNLPLNSKNNFFVIKTLFKYNLLDSSNINENILFFEENGEKFIDVLIRDKKIKIEPCYYLSSLINDKIIYLNYCKKYNSFFLSDDVISMLMVKRDNGCLALNYIDSEEFAKKFVPQLSNEDFAYLYSLLSDKRILLKNITYDQLLAVNGDKTILEEMLDEGIVPNFEVGYEIQNEKIIDILVKKKRYDLLHFSKLGLLVTRPSTTHNYLQLMIDEYKNDSYNDMHFEDISISFTDEFQYGYICQYYIQMCKNNMGRFLSSLGKEVLLFKYSTGEVLLEMLLKMDKELTVSKIVPSNLFEDIDIAMYLRMYGVKNSSFVFDKKFPKYADLYIRKYNDDYSKFIHSSFYVQELLNELEQLFLNDGKSDKDLIKVLIASYKYYTSVSEDAIKELQQLIEIKKNNMENFIYEKSDIGSYFNMSVNLDSELIRTINHETGHALHCYLADYKVPDNFEVVMERCKSNPFFLSKVSNVNKSFIDILITFYNRSKGEIENYFLDEENYSCIQEFLNKTLEEKIKEFDGKGYSKEDLKLIFGDMFSIQEYKKNNNEIEILELTKAQFDNFAPYFSIVDIIDAIVGGLYHDNLLTDENGNMISPIGGHGINYYKFTRNRFNEIIAQYSTIIKSKKAHEYLIVLRDIIGDELFKLIDDFYRNDIVNSNKYINESGRSR